MSTVEYINGMNEPRFRSVYTFNKPTRRRNLADGDVDFKHLKHDIERGVRFFWERRPDVHRGFFDFDFKSEKRLAAEAKAPARMGPPVNPVIDAAAREVEAANGTAPKGFLAQTARKYGLDPRQLLQRLYRARRSKARAVEAIT